jgi:hypothetical protein
MTRFNVAEDLILQHYTRDSLKSRNIADTSAGRFYYHCPEYHGCQGIYRRILVLVSIKTHLRVFLIVRAVIPTVLFM